MFHLHVFLYKQVGNSVFYNLFFSSGHITNLILAKLTCIYGQLMHDKLFTKLFLFGKSQKSVSIFLDTRDLITCVIKISLTIHVRLNRCLNKMVSLYVWWSYVRIVRKEFNNMYFIWLIWNWQLLDIFQHKKHRPSEKSV